MTATATATNNGNDNNYGNCNGDGNDNDSNERQRQRQMQMRGFFAALRMTVFGSAEKRQLLEQAEIRYGTTATVESGDSSGFDLAQKPMLAGNHPSVPVAVLYD